LSYSKREVFTLKYYAIIFIFQNTLATLRTNASKTWKYICHSWKKIIVYAILTI